MVKDTQDYLETYSAAETCNALRGIFYSSLFTGYVLYPVIVAPDCRASSHHPKQKHKNYQRARASFPERFTTLAPKSESAYQEDSGSSAA